MLMTSRLGGRLDESFSNFDRFCRDGLPFLCAVDAGRRTFPGQVWNRRVLLLYRLGVLSGLVHVSLPVLIGLPTAARA